ncbi:MAG: DUF2207 domain-containing protein, partial [Chloroflexi bacterium]|nr:DUF2207 domain-containing protein [Chloroflexota bacterium]
MRRITLAALIVFCLLAGQLPFVSRAADPVALDKAESYVVVLADGRLDIKYTLTFTELANGRNKISQIGPFDADSTIVSASGDGPDGVFTVNLTGSAPYYQANFERSTANGGQYTVQIHYTVDHSVFDATSYQGKDLVAIGWAPFVWGLPITRQEITYILPFELSADITTPEQVTDAVVNATGLISVDTTDFDRWVYFPTPDETTGKVWLSFLVRKDSLSPEQEMIPRFYLPASAISTTKGTVIPLKSPMPTEVPGVAAPVFPLSSEATTTLFCTGVPITVLVLILLVFALRKRKPKLSYEPPEIEIETFQTPGVVPDLNAIEAAFLMGNSTKTISLIVLALEQRGVVNIANHVPLQLEILKPDAEMAVYEQALIKAIQQDGTLDKAQVPNILNAVASVVQPKMWNADP